jgi:putative mRNA 3-end processing factor
VTESTFALPIYRWESQAVVANQINSWWRENQAAGRASLLTGYSLGKAQRLLACLDPSIGPIFEHGAVETMSNVYRAAGISLPDTLRPPDMPARYDWSQAMIVAPPSVTGTPWVRRFGDHATAFASGWMAIGGWQRRSAAGQGFVLSDHADWPALLETVRATGADEVWITHGYAATLARYLHEQGVNATEMTATMGADDA